MANRSSLELMLEKIQQLEDQPKDIPPALPVRPVSRARLPRAGRPLRLHFRRQQFEEENLIKRTKKEDFVGQFQKRVRTMDDSKGIDVIQKCYRGHKVRRRYEEFRRGVLALQSFVRGENARRNYDYGRRKRLEAIVVIQKHVRKYLKHNHCRAAYLEGVQGYRDDWHCNKTVFEPHEKANEDIVLNVPYNVLVDLRRRVLVTEARAREKKEESVALKVRIREMEEKWKRHEESMAAMEKAWQDQLMQIQKCLAAVKNNQANPEFIRFKRYTHPWRCRTQNADRNQSTTNGGILDLPINGSVGHHQHDEDSGVGEIGLEQGSNGLHPQEELCKLKHIFKAWKREYRDKLREVQLTLKKLGHSEALKSHKNWWGRLS